MNERRREYLRLLGVDALEPRRGGPLGRAPADGDGPLPAAGGDAEPLSPVVAAPPAGTRSRGEVALPVASASASADPVDGPWADLDWETLAERVRGCTACELAATRTQTVFGVGDRGAQWMLIGEAPGAEEDRQGLPFVGRAGQLLNAMLRAVGLSRDAVYIANILKCRPPNNRDPKPEEVAQCEGYLHRQVALLRPRVILCLGRVAAQNLLKVEAPLKALRGRTHVYGPSRTPVIVTYHPAYLLRNPVDKRRAWEDLRAALRVPEEPVERSAP
ncbi:MAG: uracil-DNA glycosylase [Gammaproteobacteria bacterium]|nr:uracil-DNA glycosylase [Gammaproteobacteria bacterium]